MATITVKGIPADLYERLRVSAAANRRSINSEIIVCIERSVSPRQLQPEAMIAQARRLRAKTAGYEITDAELNEAKGQGRP
jgi:plasmid stability protein